MAKQLLGKEVTAALNEKIIGQVAQLKKKADEIFAAVNARLR